VISYRYLALPGRRGIDEGRLLRPKETRRMITVSDRAPKGSSCRAVMVLRPFGSRTIDPRENCTLRKPDIFQDVIVQSGKARNGRAACPSGPEREEGRSQSCGQHLVRAVRKSQGQGRHCRIPLVETVPIGGTAQSTQSVFRSFFWSTG
jgi:hypothetical protein